MKPPGITSPWPALERLDYRPAEHQQRRGRKLGRNHRPDFDAIDQAIRPHRRNPDELSIAADAVEGVVHDWLELIIHQSIVSPIAPWSAVADLADRS